MHLSDFSPIYSYSSNPIQSNPIQSNPIQSNIIYLWLVLISLKPERIMKTKPTNQPPTKKKRNQRTCHCYCKSARLIFALRLPSTLEKPHRPPPGPPAACAGLAGRRLLGCSSLVPTGFWQLGPFGNACFWTEPWPGLDGRCTHDGREKSVFWYYFGNFIWQDEL